MAEFIQERLLPFPEPARAPGIELLDNPGVVERLTEVQAQLGFLPTSRGELNEAFGLMAFPAARGGAAKHLAEVAKRQIKYGADPDATKASLIREYAGYASRARTDLTTLLTLQEDIQDAADDHPFAAAEVRINTGLGQFARFVDLNRLAHTQDPTKYPFFPLRGYTKERNDAFDEYIATQPSAAARERIAQVIHSIRMGEARGIVPDAIQDQRSRRQYWTERVQEIEQHGTSVTRAVAHQALRGLGLAEV